MKVLMEQIKLQKEICLTGGQVMGGLYLLGMIVEHIFLNFGEGTAVYMGSVMAEGGMIMFLFLVLAVHVSEAYNYAVAMGRTRKLFFPSYVAASFVTFLVLCVWLKVLYFLEGLKLRGMYPLLEQMDPAEGPLHWKWLLGIALTGTALGMFWGAMLVKFGKAAFVGQWLLFAAVSIGGPRLLEYCMGHPENIFAKTVLHVIEAVAKLGGAAAPVLVIACSMLLLGISYLMLRRQQVNL